MTAIGTGINMIAKDVHLIVTDDINAFDLLFTIVVKYHNLARFEASHHS